jgi:UDP-N-acetylglucosamine acyltransferase
MIHSTAIIHPEAKIDSSVSIGPYTVVEAGVVMGPRCKIGPHCHILGGTHMSEDNVIHSGCVLGDSPQDISYNGAQTKLKIGKGNIFREHVTIHRGTKEETSTEIGDGNFFMANSHVAHNCKIGNHIVIVNAVLLGGHVEVEDRAFLGGGAVVHQFCRVGTLSILRGLSRISKDVPPYCMVVENNELVGLNSVGMKRAGFSLDQRSKLKEAYATLFTNGLNTTQAIEALEKNGKMTLEVQHLIRFIRHSKRGISTARKKPTDLGEEV